MCVCVWEVVDGVRGRKSSCANMILVQLCIVWIGLFEVGYWRLYTESVSRRRGWCGVMELGAAPGEVRRASVSVWSTAAGAGSRILLHNDIL